MKDKSQPTLAQVQAADKATGGKVPLILLILAIIAANEAREEGEEGEIAELLKALEEAHTELSRWSDIHDEIDRRADNERCIEEGCDFNVTIHHENYAATRQPHGGVDVG